MEYISDEEFGNRRKMVEQLIEELNCEINKLEKLYAGLIK